MPQKKSPISKEELNLLNSKIGWQMLFRKDNLDLQAVLQKMKTKEQFRKLQEELIKLHNWVIDNEKKVVVIFEGRDAAGKTGAIRRITEHINPRHFRIAALNIPSEDEKKQWYFQRYIERLPKPGEIVFFDRSWYNRAVVEPVNKFCTKKEYEIFMAKVNEFEDMLIQEDTYVFKFYYSITKKEQEKRFRNIMDDPLRRWNFTDVDKKAQSLWDDYSRYIKKMIEKTHSDKAPWHVIDANKRSQARLDTLKIILDTLPYE